MESVETIQVVLEKELLNATDRAARRGRMNRSALVRDALRAYLKRLNTEEREQRDRAGYADETDREFAVWDRVAAWPDE
jgi:metal-responsive CopG/Arc/MetJ family transcriptional regulator